MYDLLIGHTHPFSKIKINEGVKDDLMIWHNFLSNFNEKSIYWGKTVKSTEINLQSDASHKGFAAAYGSSWIKGEWPPHWLKYSIALLEIYPIYLIVKMFAPKMKNSTVNFICDNAAIVEIINKQSSKCPKIMSILRPLILTLLNNNLTFYATYINTKNNILCDRISRQVVDSNLLQVYRMKAHPETIPDHLLPANFPSL